MSNIGYEMADLAVSIIDLAKPIIGWKSNKVCSSCESCGTYQKYKPSLLRFIVIAF
jgi:hypothetical protein